jgi:hypothetical protein
MYRKACLILALTTSTACSNDHTGLIVDNITFRESELLGLSNSHRIELATITAFGISVAQGEAQVVLRPLIKKSIDEALLKHVRAELLIQKKGIDNEQLKQHYMTNPATELTVRHIVFLSERWQPEKHRTTARRRAESVIERLGDGEEFSELAAELSEEPGARKSKGLLQQGRQGSWVSEFWNAAQALELGEISPIVETQYGFHVLRLEDKKNIPFQEVRTDVVLEVANLIGPLDQTSELASLDQAEKLGVSIPKKELTVITRELDDKIFRWSNALGFTLDLKFSQVKRNARIALGSTAQGAIIARNEIIKLRPLFESIYQIELGPGI